MKAMVFHYPGSPLRMEEREMPIPSDDQILIQVQCCGVCRTDLHIYDGELIPKKQPLILGHQVVGKVIQKGKNVNLFALQDCVGVPWLAKTCGSCEFCQTDRENLCDHAAFTGYTVDGGYAEFCLANADYCLLLPKGDAVQLAPLLCAGLIGYRAYRKLPSWVESIGFYGFGSSAHILIQLATSQNKHIFAFTKEGDQEGQSLALKLGAFWVGSSNESAPEPLDGALIFAPIGALIPKALRDLKKGGSLILAGIHMSDIPSFPYQILWEERSLSSVANLTRKDGHDFFQKFQSISLQVQVSTYPLLEANQALEDLRLGKVKGSIVLKVI
jgi:propanol-preferring alcohol dehydrogenase